MRPGEAAPAAQAHSQRGDGRPIAARRRARQQPKLDRPQRRPVEPEQSPPPAPPRASAAGRSHQWAMRRTAMVNASSATPRSANWSKTLLEVGPNSGRAAGCAGSAATHTTPPPVRRSSWGAGADRERVEHRHREEEQHRRSVPPRRSPPGSSNARSRRSRVERRAHCGNSRTVDHLPSGKRRTAGASATARHAASRTAARRQGSRPARPHRYQAR